MLPKSVFEGIITKECEHCPWLNNPPENVDPSVLAIIGNALGGITGAMTCGICGCNLKLKSLVGQKCPVEDSDYNDDPEVAEWREEKWRVLEGDYSISEHDYDEIFKMRFAK